MLIKSTVFFAFILFIFNYPILHAEKQQLKVIVFDFGGVIVKGDKQQVAAFISHSLNISEEEAQHLFQAFKEYANQENNEQEFWKLYAEKKGIILPIDWFKKLEEVRLAALKEIPGMINLVKDLQKQGYQTALLSNVQGTQAAIKRKLGYYNLFHPVLLSYEIGIKKPNQQAYQLLLSKLKVSPQDVLFIDNKQQNISAAKELGIDGIVFVNTEQLIEELKKRGVQLGRVVN